MFVQEGFFFPWDQPTIAAVTGSLAAGRKLSPSVGNAGRRSTFSPRTKVAPLWRDASSCCFHCGGGGGGQAVSLGFGFWTRAPFFLQAYVPLRWPRGWPGPRR